MAINLEESIRQLTDFLKSEAKTETVIGQAFQLGEFTCVPVMKFGMGVGYGSGEGHGDAPSGKGEGTGLGAGGGIGVEPIGFLTTRGEHISFIPTQNRRSISEVFEKVPDMISKMMEKKNTKAEPVS